MAAQRLLRDFESGSGSTTHKQANLPLDQHVRDFVTALSATVKPQQITLARERIERTIAAIGCTKISQITPSKVISAVGGFCARNQKYVQKRKKPADQSPDTDQPLAVRTKRFHLQAMRQFTRWLVTERRYPHDVLASLNLRHVLKMWVTSDDTGESRRHRLWEQGLTVAEAVKQARHSDPKLTMAYTHVDQSRLRDKLTGGI